MLPMKRRRRQDADTLIWEYLDGEISPTRVGILSSLLARRAETRKRFVESSMLHGMLFEYFRKEVASSDADLMVDEEEDPPKRRKGGRTSAA